MSAYAQRCCACANSLLLVLQPSRCFGSLSSFSFRATICISCATGKFIQNSGGGKEWGDSPRYSWFFLEG
uniref:Uncharacterized protein n=1 Tax=Ixodes scapularis TaxID=6945 RepID=A0A4D5RCM0_IXOSC